MRSESASGGPTSTALANGRRFASKGRSQCCGGALRTPPERRRYRRTVPYGDDIFPVGPARDGKILRLGLVGTWESQLVGLRRLTAFLTPRLLTQSHAVDDMGLYLVFLQRHRVEVALKLILERAKAPIPVDHQIMRLFGQCEDACRAVGIAKAWDSFAGAQQPFAELIDEVDPGAATFRYPVDKKAQPWARREHVDLEALETAGCAFHDDVNGLVAALATLEPPPVEATKAPEAMKKLTELAAHCRRFISWQDEVMGALRNQSQDLARFTGQRFRPQTGDAIQGLTAVTEVSLALGDRAEALRDHIGATYGLVAPAVSDPPTFVEPPRLVPLSRPKVLMAAQDAQIRWIVDGLIEHVSPLTRAVADVAALSGDWDGHAARQLHVDVVRFRSRLMNSMRLDDSTQGDKASTAGSSDAGP